MRKRRGGVEDRWYKRDGNPTAQCGKGKRWRARYVDDRGREYASGFDRKIDAARWLEGKLASIVDGRHVAPADAQITVTQWCDRWFEGYRGNHRAASVACARADIRRIISEFGDMALAAVLPSDVTMWTGRMATDDGYAPGTVHQSYRRLSQIFSAAVHDGILGRNPCSRHTSPPRGAPKLYCATTEQVWAVYDTVPDHLRVAVLLGAFAGLRIGEAAGLRVSDVTFLRVGGGGIVHPKHQYGDAPLKNASSDAPIPIPQELVELLSASVARYPSEWMVTDGRGGACDRHKIGDAIRAARATVDGLPDTFTYHDLRHYYGTMLFAQGEAVKTVQTRMRHANPSTTLDIYGHPVPGADESTRAAVGAVLRERLGSGAETPADALRTDRGSAGSRRRSKG
jgi:integrase